MPNKGTDEQREQASDDAKLIPVPMQPTRVLETATETHSLNPAGAPSVIPEDLPEEEIDDGGWLCV